MARKKPAVNTADNGEPVAVDVKPAKEKSEPPLSNAELIWLRKNVLV